MAMPTTRPGSISGKTRKVAMASRPGKWPRTRAMAQSVPSTRATTVEKAATSIDVSSEGQSPRVPARLSYQRIDQSGGGSEKTLDEPNETATVTTSGVIRKITVKSAAIHMTARPRCSTGVMAGSLRRRHVLLPSRRASQLDPTITLTASTSRTTAVVEPSCSLRMNRNERPVRVESVWKRSPISSEGITYIDTLMEKTNATPETTP